MFRPLLLSLALSLLTAGVSLADETETIDFSELMTPTCEIAGLKSAPPPEWFNVPIQTEDEDLKGCQMMRARKEDQALVGIIRLLSLNLPEPPADAPWWAVMVSLEQENIGRMGYILGEPLWSRENVPIQGQGFSNARAVGLEASVEGDDTPQEVHFLMFEKGVTRYIITLLTPGAGVEGGRYHSRNTADFGILIQGLKQPG